MDIDEELTTEKPERKIKTVRTKNKKTGKTQKSYYIIN